MARRTRRELKEIFKAGAQPTAGDFRDTIASSYRTRSVHLSIPTQSVGTSEQAKKER